MMANMMLEKTAALAVGTPMAVMNFAAPAAKTTGGPPAFIAAANPVEASESRHSDDQSQHAHDRLQEHGTTGHGQGIRFLFQHPGCARAAHQGMPARDRPAHERNEKHRPERIGPPPPSLESREVFE